MGADDVFYIESMGPVERAYGEAMHEGCADGPEHPLSAHSPWSGSDLDGVESWSEFTAKLARHGLTITLAAPAVTETDRRDPLSPPWEDCKVCGGDHWTKDHPAVTEPDRQHVIEGLVRAYDIVKPEPGMDGPHGGHIGGPSRQKAALAIDAAIEALAAPAVTETDPIDAYLASPEAVEQLAQAMHDEEVECADNGGPSEMSYCVPLFHDLRSAAILTALRKVRAGK